MKRQIKRLAETVIALVLPLFWALWRRPRLLVLMYHRVLPLDHPEVRTEQPGMYVSPATLEMHLRVLRQRGFAMVQLENWLQRAANNQPLPKRACAITFDDGWRDNYDYAFPVLQSAKIPATIYLVSDLVGTSYKFWSNSLARILARQGMDPAQIDAAIVQYKNTHSDEQMRELVRQEAGDQDRAGERDLMDWGEIRTMSASGLIRFGSHTRRHTRLSSVTAAVLEDEIIGSRAVIGQAVGITPEAFCYPNGDTSAAAIEMVRANYASAVTTRKGWHVPHADPCTIRRIGVHEDIADRPASFLARISGWL